MMIQNIMSILIVREEIEDQPVVRVETGPLSLVLAPGLGGKVVSLYDRRNGREWLWRNPRMSLRPHAPGASYVLEADSGGWDECFPTVAPCTYPQPPWAGQPIADHGELWSQPAQLTIRPAGLTMEFHCIWQGHALPYRFERTLSLTYGTSRVHCAYAVTNLADAPLAFIWCAHPLIAIESGMRLLLPATARMQRWMAIPPELPGLSFDPLPGPEAAGALKLWSEPLEEGMVAVIARDGALRMRWDVTQLPQVAVWANLGGSAADGGPPYYNLGLEPCIGAQDSLEEAVTRYGCYAELAPGATRTWWLEVELEGS